MPLSPKQLRFAQEYIIDSNATAAAQRTGYKSAHVAGCRLLKNVNVAAEIDRLRNKLAQKAEITAQRVINELARIGFSDPRKLYDQDGSLKDIRTLDDDAASCIASVEAVEEYQGRGEHRKLVGFTKKVRLWDKVAALEKLGKHLNLFKDDQAGSIIPMVTVISFGGRPDVSQHIPAALAARIVGTNGVHPDNEAG